MLSIGKQYSQFVPGIQVNTATSEITQYSQPNMVPRNLNLNLYIPKREGNQQHQFSSF